MFSPIGRRETVGLAWHVWSGNVPRKLVSLKDLCMLTSSSTTGVYIPYVYVNKAEEAKKIAAYGNLDIHRGIKIP
jgi:hypothetical protein